MGYAEHELSLAAGEAEVALRAAVARKTGLKDFSYTILIKSLDARRKDRIRWLYRVGVSSEGIGGVQAPAVRKL